MKRKIIALALQALGMLTFAVGVAVILGDLVSSAVGWGAFLLTSGAFGIVQGALAEVGD